MAAANRQPRQLLVLPFAAIFFIAPSLCVAAMEKSLSKECWDPNEPFYRSPLIKFPNGTMISNASTAPPVQQNRPGRAQDAKIRLAIDADAYKVGQTIRITVSSDVPFEAYTVNVAATNSRPNDEYWPGNFVPSSDSPGQVLLTCGEHLNSGVASGPNRAEFREIVATWLSPDYDVGAVFFRVAVLRDNQFWVNETARLQFFPYPPPIDGCGSSQFCFRRCERQITNCPTSEAEIVYIQNKFEGSEPMTVILGGFAGGDDDFVAMGYTSDKDQLTNSDLTVCGRPMTNDSASSMKPVLEHYLMEKIEYGPKRSGLNDGFENFRLDPTSVAESSKVWCKFTRPAAGPARKTLDLRRALYRFFFSGSRGSNGEIVIPRKSAMIMTANKSNVSRVADIYYFGSSAHTMPKPAWLAMLLGLIGVYVALKSPAFVVGDFQSMVEVQALL